MVLRKKVAQSSTRPGVEPGTSWLAVGDLTNYANLTGNRNITFQEIGI